MSRKLNVQTPGEAPKADADTDTSITEQSGHAASQDALMAELAALKAENAALKKAKQTDIAAEDKALAERASRVSRADRSKYLAMHSSEVDAKTLLAPVLCRDGWLAPDRSDELPTRR